MKKADIIQRSANPNCWTYGVPALNVKWSPYLPEIIKKFRGTTAKGRHGAYTVHEFGDDELFWAWVERIDDDRLDAGWEYPNGPFTRAEEIVREIGWGDAKELALEIFGERAQVWSSGRSGGWLIVEGLPPVEEWDAIAVGQWAKFAGHVKALLDDLDYQFIWHLHVNVYENEPDYNPDAGFQLTLEDA